MHSYFDLFPEKSRTELRTLTVLPGSDLPLQPGEYAFFEFYCADRSCNCQRVVIKVLRNFRGRITEVATINYGWGDLDGAWTRLVPDTPNPFLDPLHAQAPEAGFLLEFWGDMVDSDTDYANRLQRHYHELREASQRDTEPVFTAATTADERRALRDRRRQHRKQSKRRPH